MDVNNAKEVLRERRHTLEDLKEETEERSRLGEEQQEAAGGLADYDQHPADVATATFERSKDLSIEEQLDAEIADIDRALERIEAGSYGECEVCGEPIDDERLAARPAARYCIEHQKESEAASGSRGYDISGPIESDD